MFYNTNAPADFEYGEVFLNTIRDANRRSKEYYLKAGAASGLPTFLRLLQFYMLLNNKAVYLPSKERITRSTGLQYYFDNLSRCTTAEDDQRNYGSNLLYTQTQREPFGLEDLFAIHLIEVTGQIQEVFENKIPEWARATEAVEQLGISLALKLTPKHRIRVYTRGDHIVVFTTKGIGNDVYENDYKLYRKLWACIPLLRGWIKPDQDIECPDIIELCKLLDKEDSTAYWTLLNYSYAHCDAVKDLKYSAIIQTFNSITATRRGIVETAIADCSRNADHYLKEYAKALETKRSHERTLTELISNEQSIDTSTIKMLVDKKICYSLDIASLTNGDGTISYRCAAPLLAYDKDAARVVYRKRVDRKSTRLNSSHD